MIVGVDSGGTFTDFIYINDDGSIGYLKIPSTPRRPEVAVVEGLKRIGKRVKIVIHTTTIATNAIRGQTGLELPKVALLTTKGFRDVIEIGRQNRPRLYDPFFEKPKPLVPRELRFEVDERVDWRGNILKPLNPEEIHTIGKKLQSLGVESVAICFLHSYANPTHERIAEDIVSRYVPYVSASYKVCPEPREYERTSTTVVNAALKPVVSRYISRLVEELKSLGVEELSIMSSSGGLIDAEEAIERPIQIIESGPAAGVVAATEFAKMLGIQNAISFDMGGTTAKAATITNYEYDITTEYEVGGECNYGRVVKGSGYPVKFPFIDLVEVSAGGGTVIWRDEGGALRVGPISVGADPGPVCYGKGGTQPAITDANLALGRIGDKLLGGEMRLDKESAIRALSRLGDPYEVSWQAIKLINFEMAKGIRFVTIERGLNPSDYTLIAFGGAGPQHAAELAQELGINRVVVPPHPGLFSALGLVLSDWRYEARASYPDPKRLEEVYESLEKELVKKLKTVDYFLRYADVRYVGQGWELTVPVGKPATVEGVRKAFEERHRRAYGFTMDREIEIVVARVFAVRVREKPVFRKPKAFGEPKPVSTRKVFFDGEWIETEVFWRDDLPAGYKLKGPVIIEEYDSTTVVPPGWRAYIGSLGEIVLER